MALPIERWARQAILLEKKGHLEPVASPRVWDDLRDVAILHRSTWKERQLAIDAGGGPQLAEGTYGALMAYPPAATITTTSISGTVNLYPSAVYAPIPANGVLTPQAYRIVVGGKLTTSTTPGNLGIDPRIGQTAWTTGGTAITGTTLGASGNVALTASITNAFVYVMGDLTIRSTGAPGANTVAVGMFHYVSTQDGTAGVAGPAAVSVNATAASRHNLLFGGTNASYDGSVAQGIQLGAVHTATTITWNVEQVHCMDWN